MSNSQENLENSKVLNEYNSSIACGNYSYKTKTWDNTMNNYPDLYNKINHFSSRDHFIPRTIYHDFRFNQTYRRHNTYFPCSTINTEAANSLITPHTTISVSYGFVKTCTLHSSSCQRYEPINQENKRIMGNTISSIIKKESEDFKDIRQVTLPCSL